jgi:FKBP-type peptidyl-prolyl cis-trans isomerase FklB
LACAKNPNAKRPKSSFSDVSLKNLRIRYSYMRKSALLATAFLASFTLLACKPAGSAEGESIMNGVSGNDVAATGASAPAPSMDPAANLAAAEAFLATNKTASGVKTTASGLQYAVIASGAGDGPMPSAASIVQVNYEGKLLDGTVFDSSIARGQAAEFPVGQLIPAWVEALQMMRPGDEWTIWVPPSIGYGEAGAPGAIPPNALLIFRMRLEKIVGGSTGDVGVKAEKGATR